MGYTTSAAACGQLGQDYSSYQCDDACPIKKDMVMVASTSATWWGAPAPLFCGPKEIFPHALQWDSASGINGPPVTGNPDIMNAVYGTKFNYLKNAVEPLFHGESGGTFPDYFRQKGGVYVNHGEGSSPNRAGHDDVEGCCWWGRGVIQTTGPCNIGKLNKYLIKDFYASVGSDLDLCENPQAICDSIEFPELKWNAGFFHWVNQVQEYSEDWNIELVIQDWIQDGAPRNGPSYDNMIIGVSGIVNRGCPQLHCPSGPVDGFEDREHEFVKVLDAMQI